VGQALLLVGRPGVGKTTVIRAVVDSLGDQAGGFITEEIRDEDQRDEGRRTGFRVVAFGAGPERTGMLASVNSSSCYRVGRYGVHIRDLERVGVAALQKAVAEPGITVVVVDEIGKMELFSAAFRDVVESALASPKRVVASAMTGSHPWVDAIKARVGVTQLEVTKSNRDAMMARVLAWLVSIQEER
jgi:nucleoside-triphosphatase